MQSLTPVQRVAAEFGEGAFLLLAGPGSGKTRVLTSRLVRLLVESQDDRWRMGALTFTNRAADEMRERVKQHVPDAEDRLFVGTFHSFACELLKQSGTHIGVKTDFKIYSTEEDRIFLLQQALVTAKIDFTGRLENVLKVIDAMKDRLVGPEESPSYLSNPEKSQLFVSLYRAYEDYLTAENVLDFASLIYRAYCLLTRYPAIADRYRKAYRYLSVDEFQDTNNAQYRFLRSFTGDNYKNVFVVADDDQIIYQWNGASYKRLGQFRADYTPDEVQMPTNFRCPVEVVAMANALVSHNSLRSANKQPLIAAKAADGLARRVSLQAFASDEDEVEALAESLSRFTPTQRERTAVIARTKALLDRARAALQRRDVPARLAQRRDEFVSPPYKALHLALQLAHRPSDGRTFEAWVGAANALFKQDVVAADILMTAGGKDLLSAWAAHVQRAPVTAATAAFGAFRTHLAERRDYQQFINAWIAALNAEQLQLVDEYPNFEEDARAWRELYSEIRQSFNVSSNLEGFLQELALRSKEPRLAPGELALLTIHSSKGNEFDHVFLIGLAEGVLPSFQSLQQGAGSPQLEEERRNCFVAITRCVETLTLSYARQYRGYGKAPSRFLMEMGLLQ